MNAEIEEQQLTQIIAGVKARYVDEIRPLLDRLVRIRAAKLPPRAVRNADRSEA